MTLNRLILVLIAFMLFESAALCAENAPLDFLKELVTQSSDTADHTGVNAVQAKVEKRLKSVGFLVNFIENPKGADVSGKMLVAEWGKRKRFITLVTHADTVFQTLNPFHLSEDGKKAFGSGVIDNKGGIVVGITAMEAFVKAHPDSKFSLRLVISPAEETGSGGFAESLMKFSKDSAFVIGLEPGLEDGSYVLSRKGVRWYEIHVTGRESHAGANHGAGINACVDLAEKLVKIQAFTDYEKGNTVSVGSMTGGKDKFNIVCGEASAKVDTRFSSLAAAKELFTKIEKVLKLSFAKSAKTHEGTQTTFTNSVDTPPLPESKEAEVLMKKYVDLITQIEGRTIHGEASGGVADLNQMVRPGILIADGMGPVGGAVHTNGEFLTIDSLKTRSQALSEFLGVLEHEL